MHGPHHRHSLRRTSVALVVAAMLGPLSAGSALAATCTWKDATTGNWNSLADWLSCVTGNGNPAGSPGSADTATIGATGVVTVNTAQSVLNLNNAGRINIAASTLTLANGGVTNNTGGVIDIANGGLLSQSGHRIQGGTITTTGTGAVQARSSFFNVLDGVTLNGTLDLTTFVNSRQRVVNGLTLNGAANISNGGILSFDGGNQTIGGNGTINLDATGARLALDGNGTSTLGANLVVRGQGNIGQALNAGGTNNLVNNGRISADVSGGTLTIVPGASNGKVSNNGTMDARGGGTLDLSATINNTAGQISALNGSFVDHSGVAVTGGGISTVGTGVFRATSSVANFLDGVNFSGTLDMATHVNSRERIINGATINGVVNIANGGILSLDSSQTPGGNQTINGNAVINLNAAGARLATDGTGNTTLAAGITVRGQGNIGDAFNAGGVNVLTNNGLISADVNGGTLNITAPSNSGSFINSGTLQAVNGGTLKLSTNIAANAGSQIISGAGSTVVQNGVTIHGVFAASGGGKFTAVSSAANFLDGVNFSGVLDVGSLVNARERIINGATINGAIDVSNGGILSLDGSQTAGGHQALAGNLVVNLNDAGARLAIDGNGSTTLGAGVTVRGQGNIGTAFNAGGTNALTNNGLISADVGGATLDITAPGNSGSVLNNGTLRAVNGGLLKLSTNINNAGQIIAGAGSTVVQNGATVNGVIDASAAGATFAAVSSGANVLNGVSFAGTLDLTSFANARQQIINGARLNGAVNVGSSGILSLNSAATTGGAQTIAGNGVINLNAAGARLSIDGNGSTTFAAGITVRGEGNIGQAFVAGGVNALTNNGLISADVNGGTLTITSPGNSGSLVNNATVQAVGGGRLVLSTDINNTGGLISAQNGSVVVQNGVTISGGTIGSGGTGAFQAASSGANVLSNVTINGVVDMATLVNGRQQIVNGATLNGAINVGSGGILSLNSAATSGGAQTIAGTGVINLNAAGARLSIDGNGSTTLASGILVRGQGNIGQAFVGGGTNTLFNNGTILADGGMLTIAAPANSGSLAGTGTLQANGGTLSIATNTAATQGKLIIGGAGSTVNLNTQNLTLTGDYTNAQSDSGNAFNRRAGVVGTGKILAGGDVAQVIAGASVSNGNTANATLTIGNMRVGANTVNYQVGNSGTTGPTLRGAIQTSVNGGNLTDGRLSGAGVTAANYNTGGPGASTGNLGVTFTAAAAGALAPLVGQVVNLRSNFENIADQKLNIVLAGNAAAFNAAVGNAGPSPVNLGNFHVGAAGGAAPQSQGVAISNTVAGPFTEGLGVLSAAVNGAFSLANNIGNTLVAAGGTAANALTVSRNGGAAGVNTGTLSIQYSSDGTGTSGLAAIGSNSQNVAVNATGYRLASANTIDAVNFGNVHVGDAVTRALSISNTAVNDVYSEKLNASFGGVSDGRITTNGGAISLLGAGQTNAASMVVGLNTGAAGNVNGTVTVRLQSDGTGTSGLGTTGLPDQNVGVSGNISALANVYRLASASPASPNPVNFQNVRINAVTDQALTISNTAVNDGFSEKLNASIGGATAGVTSNGGSFNLLGPQASNNSSLRVGIDTSSAGAKNGTATITLVSDGTGTSGLGQTTLVPQTVAIQGNVFRLATGSAGNAPVDLGAFRVGLSTPAGASLSVANVAAADGFSEQLGIQSVSSGSGLFTAASTLGGTRVNAGASAANAIAVGAGNGLVAGVNSGQVTVQFLSDGTASGTGGAIAVNSQQVAVTAKGYTAAAATLVSAPVIDFGTVRVGTALAAQEVTIHNVAAVTTLNDTLRGTLSVAGAGFSGNGATVAGLGAGQGNAAGTLQIGLDTASAGVKAGVAQVAFTSQNPDMADLALAPSDTIALSGTVNALAQARFSQTGGSGHFSCASGVCTLDLGTLVEGSGASRNELKLENLVNGPADDLQGDFDFSALLASFGATGFGRVDLSGGGEVDNLALIFDAATVGSYSSHFTFNGFSHNDFQSDYALGPIQFVLEAKVIGQGGGDVPEPGTLWLLLAAAAGAVAARRRVAC